VGAVVELVVVVSGTVVDVVVVAGSVVLVAAAEVVVGLGCPYDQTYSGPGSPSFQARQSAQVGRKPAA
jgi:hypothetical protein